LISVSIGNSVTYIEVGAFLDCISLTNVVLGNNVRTIGNAAFSGCSSLTRIEMPHAVKEIGIAAFSDCTNLTGMYFWGGPAFLDGNIFWPSVGSTVYYLAGSRGWGSTFSGSPTAYRSLPFPVLLTGEAPVAYNLPSFGVRTNSFGFEVSWTTNRSVVVEACTNVANPNWAPVATNNVSGGTFYFSDPQWTNYPNRFYRVRPQ
jgi:hypothetical protein